MSTQLVHRESRRFAALPHILAICLVALSLGGAPDARAADEGAITGRVLNPSTGDYLRNASVRLQETGLSATTEDGGVYRFSPISPGAYTVEVSYTGFHSAIATVQVFPADSHHEKMDLPMVLLEGMSEEVATVVANKAPLSELVQAGAAIGVPQMDPVGLAAAVVELMRVPERCEALAKAGRALVEQRFDVRQVAARYESIYDDVLGAARSQGQHGRWWV